MSNTENNNTTPATPDFGEVILKLVAGTYLEPARHGKIPCTQYDSDTAHWILERLINSPEALNALGLVKLEEFNKAKTRYIVNQRDTEIQLHNAMGANDKLQAELKSVREKLAACAAIRNRLF